MGEQPQISYTAALILLSLDAGHQFGFDVIEATGLASGTVYPALRRLEKAELVESRWEEEGLATDEGRPARRYYRLTKAGKTSLAGACERYLLPEIPKVPKRRQQATVW